MGGFFKVENYKKGSYIIVEGKKNADKFYIIHTGKLRIIREVDYLKDTDDQLLGPGDFFGVISCMSARPRLDTVLSLTDCSLIAVRHDQFGVLIQKNAPVAIKIIRYFSKKLREYDSTITKISFRKEAVEDVSHLFQVGEYYLKEKQYGHAIYAYRRYLQYVPNGKDANTVKQRLAAISRGGLPAGLQKFDSMTRKFPDNTMLFCEGEPGHELYVIQKGNVKITKIVGGQEVLLAVLNPGDIFGEMAILENKPRSASAITKGETVLLAVNKKNFEVMVKQQPQLATRLIELLSERIWLAHRQLQNLLLMDPVGKMYDMLLMLVEKERAVIENRAVFRFDIGPKELAKMIGMDYEEAEPYLQEILKQKFMTVADGKFLCNNLLEIEKQVSFYRKKSAIEQKRQRAKAQLQ